MCMTSWGILIEIRITIDTQKQWDVWSRQVFKSLFKSPSIYRNKNVYDIFRYSHRYSNHIWYRETRTCMMTAGILIDIRITFYKKKGGFIWHLNVFLSIFESLSTKKNKDVETTTWLMSSAILIIIGITFDIEKRRHEWCLQLFSSLFESLST